MACTKTNTTKHAEQQDNTLIHTFRKTHMFRFLFIFPFFLNILYLLKRFLEYILSYRHGTVIDCH